MSMTQIILIPLKKEAKSFKSALKRIYRKARRGGFCAAKLKGALRAHKKARIINTNYTRAAT